jgi:hypothetical protein
MSKAIKITITLDDSDEPIEFCPLHEVHISITRGHRDSPTVQDTYMGYPLQEFNGVEVMLVICAPKEIKDEIVKAAMEIIDKNINT